MIPHHRPPPLDTTVPPALLRDGRGIVVWVALFSAAMNLLMLTGPLYMLSVYDRVLSSRSVETLVALTGLALGLTFCGTAAVSPAIRCGS